MKLEEIDQNLKVEASCGRNDLVFMDVRREPFRIYGLYRPHEGAAFIRLPADVASATNDGVAGLAYHTAGGRVRFATNSPFIAIRCKMNDVTRFPHMPLAGSSGFDLYIHADGRDTYHHTFMPPVDMKNGYESLVPAAEDGAMHTYTIHFPLYNGVVSLEVGVLQDANLDAGAAYRDIPPIVYYGSSITQGGCASRPGNAYQNIISAHRNIDHVNLGFSGSARGEDVIADYMASLQMSLFVMDYDHNAPNAEHLRATHDRLYQKIRAAHPKLPILMITKPDARVEPDAVLRRNVVYETYYHAYTGGDKNVFFIDGYTFFEGEYHDCGTVDGCHPNDFGFVCMAKTIGHEIDRILRRALW